MYVGGILLQRKAIAQDHSTLATLLSVGGSSDVISMWYLKRVSAWVGLTDVASARFSSFDRVGRVV